MLTTIITSLMQLQYRSIRKHSAQELYELCGLAGFTQTFRGLCFYRSADSPMHRRSLCFILAASSFLYDEHTAAVVDFSLHEKSSRETSNKSAKYG